MIEVATGPLIYILGILITLLISRLTLALQKSLNEHYRKKALKTELIHLIKSTDLTIKSFTDEYLLLKNIVPVNYFIIENVYNKIHITFPRDFKSLLIEKAVTDLDFTINSNFLFYYHISYLSSNNLNSTYKEKLIESKIPLDKKLDNRDIIKRRSGISCYVLSLIVYRYILKQILEKNICALEYYVNHSTNHDLLERIANNTFNELGIECTRNEMLKY